MADVKRRLFLLLGITGVLLLPQLFLLGFDIQKYRAWLNEPGVISNGGIIVIFVWLTALTLFKK